MVILLLMNSQYISWTVQFGSDSCLNLFLKSHIEMCKENVLTYLCWRTRWLILWCFSLFRQLMSCLMWVSCMFYYHLTSIQIGIRHKLLKINKQNIPTRQCYIKCMLLWLDLDNNFICILNILLNCHRLSSRLLCRMWHIY